MRFVWILFSFVTAIPCPQNTMYLIGSYRPQCHENGNWHPKQCWGSTGSCWCVDSEGERVSKDVAPGVPLDCSTVSNVPHN
jgi:hypothetical protein